MAWVMLLILSLIATPIITDPTPKNDTLSIVSWNIFLRPSPFIESQYERSYKISEYLLSENSDILLIQEAFNRTAVNNLIKILKPTYPYIIEPESNSLLKISSGLLVLSKYPIVGYEHYFYADCKSLDCLSAKGFIVFSIELSDRIITIVNTHNQSDDRYNQTRINQYQQIKETLDNRNDNIQIIGGDLNSNGFTYDVTNIEGVFDVCIKPYNSFTWSDDKTHCAYDYIFINKDVLNEVKRLEDRVMTDNMKLSDHKPIKFSIILNK